VGHHRVAIAPGSDSGFALYAARLSCRREGAWRGG
jgi:hypothetical protein